MKQFLEFGMSCILSTRYLDRFIFQKFETLVFFLSVESSFEIFADFISHVSSHVADSVSKLMVYMFRDF